MVITSYLNLLHRHRKAITILVILALIPAAYIGNQKRATTYDTTIFISISSKAPVADASSALDETEASDMFTETVQGWFRNPLFQKSIAGEITALSASKQEKQNLLITYTTKDEQQAATAAQSIRKGLTLKMNEYNMASSTDFTHAIFDINTTPDKNSFMFYILLGLIAGLTMGVAFSYGIEYFYGVVIHRWQIENILGKNVDDIIRNRKVENYNLSYILARIKKFNTKHITIAGINFSPNYLTKAINESNPKLDVTSVIFPDEAVTITDHPKNPIVIVAEIGTSTLDSIQKIKPLLDENFIIITKE